MIRVLFVCHGNICRSPMAEFIFREMIKNNNINDVLVASAATSTEEIGNGVHYGTKEVLNRLGIDCSAKRAVQLVKSDYEKYDYIIGMDEHNIRNILRIAGGDPMNKISLFLSHAGENRSVADPWYSGDFETTFNDVVLGCNALLSEIKKAL